MHMTSRVFHQRKAPVLPIRAMNAESTRTIFKATSHRRVRLYGKTLSEFHTGGLRPAKVETSRQLLGLNVDAMTKELTQELSKRLLRRAVKAGSEVHCASRAPGLESGVWRARQQSIFLRP